jgi:hypothetical protein
MDGKEFAVVAALASLEEEANHLDGFREHVLAHVRRRPRGAAACSLSSSPLPLPRKNRPGMRQAVVAGAWAMMRGEYARLDM